MRVKEYEGRPNPQECVHFSQQCCSLSFHLMLCDDLPYGLSAKHAMSACVEAIGNF